MKPQPLTTEEQKEFEAWQKAKVAEWKQEKEQKQINAQKEFDKQAAVVARELKLDSNLVKATYQGQNEKLTDLFNCGAEAFGATIWSTILGIGAAMAIVGSLTSTHKMNNEETIAIACIGLLMAGLCVFCFTVGSRAEKKLRNTVENDIKNYKQRENDILSGRAPTTAQNQKAPASSRPLNL